MTPSRIQRVSRMGNSQAGYEHLYREVCAERHALLEQLESAQKALRVLNEYVLPDMDENDAAIVREAIASLGQG